MEFMMKLFRFVICSAVIYGCFEGNVAKIGAENAALEEKTNKVGGEENKFVILDEEFPNASYPELKTKSEKDGERKEYSAYTVDDEDGEKEISGDEEDYVQSDEPSPLDGNDKSVNVQPESSSYSITTSTRALEQTVSANATTTFVTTAPIGNATVYITPTKRTDGNSSNTVATNPLFSSPYMSGGNTIDTAAAAKSSIHAPPPSSRASKPYSAIVSRSMSVNPTGLTTKQTKTIETTTKGGGDVQNQKDPTPNETEDRKTLFGFVTIEILVALLAGAACAVILLVFLVHRLKKRNEGSYELQETINLKTAAYAEEKEVFV
ncbi:uncharacterized protein LOC144665568 [Oculina patagonica]